MPGRQASSLTSDDLGKIVGTMTDRIIRATACAIGISLAAVVASSAQTARSPDPPVPMQTYA